MKGRKDWTEVTYRTVGRWRREAEDYIAQESGRNADTWAEQQLSLICAVAGLLEARRIWEDLEKVTTPTYSENRLRKLEADVARLEKRTKADRDRG